MTDSEQFDRLIRDLQSAREAFNDGDSAKARALLNVVGSIALSKWEFEYGPGDPMPMSAWA